MTTGLQLGFYMPATCKHGAAERPHLMGADPGQLRVLRGDRRAGSWRAAPAAWQSRDGGCGPLGRYAASQALLAMTAALGAACRQGRSAHVRPHHTAATGWQFSQAPAVGAARPDCTGRLIDAR